MRATSHNKYMIICEQKHMKLTAHCTQSSIISINSNRRARSPVGEWEEVLCHKTRGLVKQNSADKHVSHIKLGNWINLERSGIGRDWCWVFINKGMILSGFVGKQFSFVYINRISIWEGDATPGRRTEGRLGTRGTRGTSGNQRNQRDGYYLQSLTTSRYYPFKAWRVSSVVSGGPVARLIHYNWVQHVQIDVSRKLYYMIYNQQIVIRGNI